VIIKKIIFRVAFVMLGVCCALPAFVWVRTGDISSISRRGNKYTIHAAEDPVFFWILVTCSIVLSTFWFYVALRGEDVFREKPPLDKDEFRCFGCGGVVHREDESCQACGWSWKTRPNTALEPTATTPSDSD